MQWLNVILTISGMFEVAAGAGLLLMPKRMPRAQGGLQQWLLEHNLATKLNRYQSIERPLYRHHRIFGTAVIAGAFILLALLGRLYTYLFASGTLIHLPGVWLAMLAGFALAIMILVIGITIVIRPSALKRLEAISNRWIEPFPASADYGINLIWRFPKQTGMLLLMAGIACLWAAARMTGAYI